MAIACPNIQSPEWKKLVNSIGETEAYGIFMANGDSLPDMDTVREIIKRKKGDQFQKKPFRPGYFGEEGATSNPSFKERRERLINISEAYNMSDKNFLPKKIDYHKLREDLSRHGLRAVNIQKVSDGRYKLLDKDGNWIKPFGKEANLQKVSFLDQEDFDRLNEKKEALQNSLNVKVIYDPDLDAYGKAYGKDSSQHVDALEQGYVGAVAINPNIAKEDTLIHEFGHLYIDMLGGMNNAFIAEGIKRLRGSKVEEEVEENYPELSKEQKDKEMLATAVGREGAKIFDEQASKNKFMRWVETFFNKLKKLLGINRNTARELARDLLSNRIRSKEITDDISDIESYQKDNSKSRQDLNNTLKKIDQALLTKLKTGRGASDNYYKKWKELKKEVENTMETANDLKKMEDIMNFIEKSTEEINKADKLIHEKEKEGTLNADKLFRILSYLDTYDVLEDIKKNMDSIRDRDEDSMEEGEKYLKDFLEEKVEDEDGETKSRYKILDEVIGKQHKLRNRQLELSINVVAEYMNRNDKKLFNIKRKEYADEYMESLSPEEQKKQVKTFDEDNERGAKMREYVERKIKENREEIEKEQLEMFKGLLRQNEKDINPIMAYLGNTNEMNSITVNWVYDILENSTNNALREFEDFQRTIEETYKPWVEERWSKLSRSDASNMKKLNDPFLEKINGKYTGFLLGKYYSTVQQEKKEFYRKVHKMKEEKTFEQEVDNFMKKKGVKRDNPEKYYMAVHLGDIESRNINPDYEKFFKNATELDKKMYQAIRNRMAENDRDVKDPFMRLGTVKVKEKDEMGNDTGKTFTTYKFPAIKKDVIEQMKENGIKGAGRDIVTNIAFEEVDDTFMGQIEGKQNKSAAPHKDDHTQEIIDTKLENKRGVPVFFRGELENGVKDQSFDVMNNLLLDTKQVMDHKHKKHNEGLVRLIAHIAEERVTVKRNVKGEPVGDPIKGSETNEAKKLRGVIEHFLHGVSTKGGGEIPIPGTDTTISGNKLARSIKSYTSMVGMAGNFFAGGATMLHGLSMQFMEAGGDIINRQNFKNAWKYYVKSKKDDIDDAAGKRLLRSKTNKLLRYLNVQDFSVDNTRAGIRSRTVQLLSPNVSYAISSSFEHFVHGTMMNAVIDTAAVKDKDGDYIDSNGNKVSKRKDSASLLNMIKDNKEKPLEIDSRVKEVEFSGKKYDLDSSVSRSAMFNDLSKVVNDRARVLFGNYHGNNKSEAERNAWGALGYIFRKWLIPGFLNRWRGARSIHKDVYQGEDLRKGKFYNEAIGRFDEGTYTSFLKFMMRLFKEGKLLKFHTYKENWNKMDDMQRRNTVRAIRELAMITSAIAAHQLISMSLEDLDDEDKRSEYFLLAYYIRRLQTELTVYLPFSGEATKILQNPTAATGVIQDIVELGYRLLSFNALEEYERDSGNMEEGDLKITKEFQDIVPGANIYNRSTKESYEWIKRSSY